MNEKKYNYTEEQAKSWANAVSVSVVDRSYTDGNSRDERRWATPEESAIVKAAIFGALLAARSGYDAHAAANTAEYIAMVGLPEYKGHETHINVYDSVYCPIKEFLMKHETAEVA